MKIKIKLAGILILAILMVNVAFAATVEVTTPGKLPVQLREGEQVDLSIKIGNYEDSGQLTLETNLIPSSTDKPLWDFGDSNPIIDVNRYQQKVALNLSSLPAILNVHISGKVPSGETTVKYNDLVLTKLTDTKLKFYEIRADEKLVGIESFELIIKKREDFEKTLQSVRSREFDDMKTEVRKVFNIGLTTEAQNIANDMSNVKWPNSLLLFGLIKVESDLMLNIIVIGLVIIVFIVGYLLGARGDNDNEDDT